MPKKILVFNVGSSSIRYSLFQDLDKLSYGKKDKLTNKESYKKATIKILEELKEEKIDLVIHRVVHGGDYKTPQKINSKVKKQIKKFGEFAPLHNPKQLIAIELCEKLKIPQYAVFDTMFYTTIPKVAKTYAIPKSLTNKYKIEKYGFHGISHKFISKGINGKTITCHLGSGCSITAIENGKAIDTSMGLTPLEGIMMGTRSGSIDPGIIFFLENKGYNIEKILNHESGLKGVSGYWDFRKIKTKLKNKDVKLAYDMFVYQISKTIGSYIATLNGLDNLIFTASIGENVPRLRKEICENLKFMGIKIDKNKNEKNLEIISKKDSKVKVHVKQTNEEKQLVKEVLKI